MNSTVCGCILALKITHSPKYNLFYFAEHNNHGAPYDAEDEGDVADTVAASNLKPHTEVGKAKVEEEGDQLVVVKEVIKGEIMVAGEALLLAEDVDADHLFFAPHALTNRATAGGETVGCRGLKSYRTGMIANKITKLSVVMYGDGGAADMVKGEHWRADHLGPRFAELVSEMSLGSLGFAGGKGVPLVYVARAVAHGIGVGVEAYGIEIDYVEVRMGVFIEQAVE